MEKISKNARQRERDRSKSTAIKDTHINNMTAYVTSNNSFSRKKTPLMNDLMISMSKHPHFRKNDDELSIPRGERFIRVSRARKETVGQRSQYNKRKQIMKIIDEQKPDIDSLMKDLAKETGRDYIPNLIKRCEPGEARIDFYRNSTMSQYTHDKHVKFLRQRYPGLKIPYSKSWSDLDTEWVTYKEEFTKLQKKMKKQKGIKKQMVDVKFSWVSVIEAILDLTQDIIDSGNLQQHYNLAPNTIYFQYQIDASILGNDAIVSCFNQPQSSSKNKAALIGFYPKPADDNLSNERKTFGAAFKEELTTMSRNSRLKVFKYLENNILKTSVGLLCNAYEELNGDLWQWNLHGLAYYNSGPTDDKPHAVWILDVLT